MKMNREFAFKKKKLLKNAMDRFRQRVKDAKLATEKRNTVSCLDFRVPNSCLDFPLSHWSHCFVHL